MQLTREEQHALQRIATADTKEGILTGIYNLSMIIARQVSEENLFLNTEDDGVILSSINALFESIDEREV